jgi:hypothetical protein
MRRFFVLSVLVALPACNRELTCEVELTQGSAVYRGSQHGSRSEASLRRDAMLVACGQLCAARGRSPDCVGRCAEDAGAGKNTARTSCKESPSR